MRQPQQQYHCAPRRLLLPRRRLLLLVCLVWLCAATATSSSRSMRPPFHHHHRVTAAFLLRLPSAQRTLASAASAFAVVSSSVATEAPPPQPTSKQPPKAPPRSIALDTEAGRAVLRRGWGVESAADVKIVSADEWRPAAERHRWVGGKGREGWHVCMVVWMRFGLLVIQLMSLPTQQLYQGRHADAARRQHRRA